MILGVLNTLKTELESMAVKGGVLEGVESVRVGDFHPIPDRLLPCITLDCLEQPAGATGQARGSRMEWRYEFQVALYTAYADPGKAQQEIWRLVSPSEPNEPKGLVYALASLQRVELPGSRYMLLESSGVRFGAYTGQSRATTMGAIVSLRGTTWGVHP